MALDEHARTIPKCIREAGVLGVSGGANHADFSKKGTSIPDAYSRAFRYFSVACADAAPRFPYSPFGFYVVPLCGRVLRIGTRYYARGCLGGEPEETRKCDRETE